MVLSFLPDGQASNEALTEMTEGRAVFLAPAVPKSERRSREPKPSVFYNPKMSLNRDLAVLFLKSWKKKGGHWIRVADPFAGCGVRSIRFALEASDISEIVAGDISEKAVSLLKMNIARNNLDEIIRTEHSEANALLSKYASPKMRFDFIDVDPFGSPAIFLESAIRALRDGGVLAITATDMAPLCGVHVGSCVRRYFSKPIRTEYVHELALRILISSVVLAGARNNVALRPLFSHSTDHYLRAYLGAAKGAKVADEEINELGFWGHCQNCLHREPIPGLFSKYNRTCHKCGGKWLIAGPLWLGHLGEMETCQNMIRLLPQLNSSSKSREAKLLNLIAAELSAPIGYFVFSVLADHFGTGMPPLDKFFRKIHDAGFTACRTHFHPQ